MNNNKNRPHIETYILNQIINLNYKVIDLQKKLSYKNKNAKVENKTNSR